MCINNDTIVKWTQRKQQLHLARSGRLSVLASEQGWILQGRGQVRALWAEHEGTWCVLNVPSHLSGLRSAGSAHWGQGLLSGECPPIPSCRAWPSSSPGIPLEWEPTGICRSQVSEDWREKAGGKERPFMCQAVLDSRDRMGALPLRTLQFSCEEREFYEGYIMYQILRGARIEEWIAGTVSLSKWKGMPGRVS